ncbi:MAG: hypothetical protein IAE97_01560 [Chthoniobacterales bacterium]|nr:hypothetical protein [Chthoniobacterales bacterium]
MISKATSSVLIALLTLSGLFLLNSGCELISDLYEGKPLPPFYYICDSLAPLEINFIIIPALAGIIAWRSPILYPALIIPSLVLSFSLLFLAGSAAMHTYLNDTREVAAWRYVGNAAWILLALTCVFWPKITKIKNRTSSVSQRASRAAAE